MSQVYKVPINPGKGSPAMNPLTSELLVAKGITRRAFVKHGSLTLFAMSPAISFLDRAWAADPNFVVAETAFGKIRGVDVQGIKIFKGVPYGDTTAGKNRFMPPANPVPWTAVRDALHYGSTAPQGYGGVVTSSSEFGTPAPKP